jgi:hypothetical protein
VVSVAERRSHSAGGLMNHDRLACKAFNVVFQRRQTQHRALLAWLRAQMAASRPSSSVERQMLESAAAWRVEGAEQRTAAW